MPRSRADARDHLADSSPSSTRTVRAEERAEPAQRVELLGLGRVGPAPRREHGEDVHLGPEPLRRAPRAAHHALGGGLRRDEGQQPLADGLRHRLADHAVLVAHGRRLAHEPLGLDALGDLAQRDLAQRLEVLDAEEAVQRGRHALGLVHLARAQPLDQRRRRDVDEHDLVGLGQHGVRERLAHAHAR